MCQVYRTLQLTHFSLIIISHLLACHEAYNLPMNIYTLEIHKVFRTSLWVALFGSHWLSVWPLQAGAFFIILFLGMFVQRNIRSYIYAPNCGVGQSPEREGHPCPADQDIRATTVSWILYNQPTNHLFAFRNTRIHGQLFLCFPWGETLNPSTASFDIKIVLGCFMCG